MLNIRTNPIIQDVKLPDLRDRHVKVLREDLVHPFTGGNKWRKLKYNLIDFREQNKKVLLTFGGAFSNHLSYICCCKSIGNRQHRNCER